MTCRVSDIRMGEKDKRKKMKEDERNGERKREIRGRERFRYN